MQRIKLPSILGFLVTGIIIGPYGLSLVDVVDQVEVISEIGVILLLFVIGMELSLKQLISIKRTVFIGGPLQVALTVLVSGLVYYLMGGSLNESVFIGFLFSLSSTAVVLKILQDRNEISSPHGRNALGILIFQDIIIVPMMLVAPIMAGQTSNITMSVVSLLVKTIIVIGITIISARYIVPRLMYTIARTKSKELFLIATMTICFAVAFLTSMAGLSLALGAFLAGLIISESEYSHQATSIILPFRELFASFFFISVGMLLDLNFFVNNVAVIMAVLTIVFLVKTTIASLAVAVLKYPPRTVLLTGLSLFQVGEFAFILSKVGIQYNILTKEANQYFLAVSILSMVLTPFVIMYAERISRLVLRPKSGSKTERMDSGKIDKKEDDHYNLTDHLIIIGYGINGSNLAKAAKYSDIPYVVIELNAQTVKAEKQKGIPVLFGDASNVHILETARLIHARAVVIAISDPVATKRIISNIRMISQSVYLLVRTRYVHETDELIALGADDVIPEEFETSLEIFSRILHNFLVPVDDIDNFIELIRSDNYHLLQAKKKLPITIKTTKIPDFKVTCVTVNRDSGKIVGKSIKDSHIRAEYGINILAISRNDKMIYDISPDEMILQNDLVFVHGKPENVDRFHKSVS
ncbi:MAG: cation:proton antiporter [Bacteroidales bacterium]|nr:cation:proton antiporter [Bacteroidales bacterium]